MLKFGAMMLLSLADQKVIPNQECYIKTNGCSIPGDLPFFYKKPFTPACVKHGVCYSCGQNFGGNRSGCEKSFKQDMYMLCDKKYGRKKRWISLLASKIKRCKFLADLYYKSVRIFGRFYWSNLSEN
ncbi:unnamed protein product, partial [Porites lobata]